MPFFRKRQKVFGEVVNMRCGNGEFVGARAENGSLNADDVAEIE